MYKPLIVVFTVLFLLLLFTSCSFLKKVTEGNKAPVADAGADQTASVDTLVTLDGGSSSDPDDDPLEYSWLFKSKPLGSGAVIVGADQSVAYFISDIVGVYDVELTVFDGQDSDTATVRVTAEADISGNVRPVADAGSNQTVNVLDSVSFDGSGSSDEDGEIVSYAWIFGDGTSESGVTTSHTYTEAGTYEVGLIVTDDGGKSDLDTIYVTVLSGEANVAPPVPAGLTVGSETESTLRVSWDASVGASSYQLYRDTSAFGEFTTLVYDGADTSFTDTGLEKGTTYYYRVQAVNEYGSSELSAPVAGTTITPSGSSNWDEMVWDVDVWG